MKKPPGILAKFRLTPALIWAATAVGLLVQLSFFIVIAIGFYRAAIGDVEKAASNIASLLEAGLARDVELYDLSLQAVSEGMEDADVMRQPPRIRQVTLFDRSATAKGLGALVALNAEGDIILDSLSVTPRRGNFADREYFQVHKTRQVDLYVSEPFRARLQQNIWSISLSRRVNRADGSFGGIVSGTVKLDYIRDRFARANVGPEGTVSLLRDDGILIVQSAGGRHEPGEHWPSVIKQMKDSTAGIRWSEASLDGTDRVYAYRRISDTPLVISVGLSSGTALAPWWSTVGLLALAYMGMAASVVALVGVFVGELRKRRAAELLQAALARRDELTGLANRLGFSETLEKAWRSGSRHRKPLSLLMLDLDYFKQFNDLNGHLDGDNALRQVGTIVGQLARQPYDVAARYGGEEIAVLLPDTPLAGALAIAKLLRFSIEALAIPHPGSTHRVITASIGVATMMPDDREPALLVAKADEALYRAKQTGRNCVVAAIGTADDGASPEPPSSTNWAVLSRHEEQRIRL